MFRCRLIKKKTLDFMNNEIEKWVKRAKQAQEELITKDELIELLEKENRELSEVRAEENNMYWDDLQGMGKANSELQKKLNKEQEYNKNCRMVIKDLESKIRKLESVEVKAGVGFVDATDTNVGNICEKYDKNSYISELMAQKDSWKKSNEKAKQEGK